MATLRHVVARDGNTVRIKRHARTGAWLVEQHDDDWIVFADKNTKEHIATSIVLANVPGCERVDIVET